MSWETNVELVLPNMGKLLRCISKVAKQEFEISDDMFIWYVYCIFAQFMQFLVLDLELDHSGSRHFV